eukprot:GFYU01013791.1.p1 GENE.GFYU01013791.1~~GFYU01013791.1.p1  ORF type:complete len:941 (+),score=303.86 GFYU01013791.1:279-3101(+)
MMDQLLENPVFTGGISFALVGMLSGVTLALYNLLSDYVTRMFFLTVEVKDSEACFDWVIKWTSKQPTTFANPRFKVSLKGLATKSFFNSSTRFNDTPSVEFLPGGGGNVIKYKGRRVWVYRSEGEPMNAGFDNEPTVISTLMLACYGRDLKFLKDLLNEAAQDYKQKDRDKTLIFVLHRWGICWVRAQARTPRPQSSVILESSSMTDLVEDIRVFLQSEEWYRERGIPWRRGYCLYGSPGCGKTSAITVIAGALKMNICVLTLSSKRLDDDDLNARLCDTPPNSIILLEDVDSIFEQRETKTVSRYRYQRGVSFSGLLNALDGVSSQEGRIVFMTTNHIERLDAALLRPGRCDVKKEFTLATRNQISAMYTRFFPEETRPSSLHELARQPSQAFVTDLPDRQLSMAEVQSFFMRHKDDPSQALKSAHELLQKQTKAAKEKGKISVWLHRLGLQKYTNCFNKVRMYDTEDLKELNEGDIKALGVKNSFDLKRIMAMLNGDKVVREQFDYLDETKSITVFLKWFPDNMDSGLTFGERIMELKKVSGFMADEYLSKQKSASEAASNTWTISLPSESGSTSEDFLLQDAPMNTLTFLSRAGLEAFYGGFLLAGCDQSSEIATLNEVALTAVGIKDDDKTRLTDIIGYNREARRLFSIATASDAERLFRIALPSATPEQAKQFASKLPADRLSGYQIQDYLSAHADAEGAILASEYLNNLADSTLLRATEKLSLDDLLRRAGMSEMQPQFKDGSVSLDMIPSLDEKSFKLLKIVKDADKKSFKTVQFPSQKRAAGVAYVSKTAFEGLFLSKYCQQKHLERSELSKLAKEAVAALGDTQVSWMQVDKYLEFHRHSAQEAIAQMNKLKTDGWNDPPKALDIETWLKQVGADISDAYSATFKSEGLVDTATVKSAALTEGDLKDALKVEKLGHLKRIMMALEKLSATT